MSSLGIGEGMCLSVPRDRLGEFKPLLLEVIKEQQSSMHRLFFELYSKGLSTRDIEQVSENIYGKRLSKSRISDITQAFKSEVIDYLHCRIEDAYPIIYIDSTFIRTQRETVSSEAYYVVLGVKEDTTKEVVGIYNSPTESATIWEEIFKDLKDRGLQQVSLVVCDNLLGIDSAIEHHYSCNIPKCVLHLKRSQDFANPWSKHYPHLKTFADKEFMRYYSQYLSYHPKIRNRIYTTNSIERLNKDFKRTIKISNSIPSVESVLTLMGKVAMNLNSSRYTYKITRLSNNNLFNNGE